GDGPRPRRRPGQPRRADRQGRPLRRAGAAAVRAALSPGGQRRRKQEAPRWAGLPVMRSGDDPAGNQAGTTLAACEPFGPWTTSKLTRWPSWSVRKPLALMAE